MPAKSIFTGRVLMALVMFLIFTTLVGIALEYPAQARFMPLVVGIPGIALTLLELVREIRRALSDGAPTESGGDTGIVSVPGDVSRLIGQEGVSVGAEAAPMSAAETQRREWALLAYFTALIAGILVFGFWIAVPAFIVTFLREREHAKWTLTIGLAAAATAVVYVVFHRVLGIDLFTGFVTQSVWDALFLAD